MNTSGITTLASVNVITPASTVAKLPVGLENGESKEEILPPVEESSASSPSADRRDGSQQTPDQNDDETEQQRVRAVEQQEQQIVRELAARHREVIAHEQAHAAVGGQYAGSPSYTYERGPDGVNYAVAGEVPISLPSGNGDPAETIAAAQQVRRAALAPADPSPQDRLVAAKATQLLLEAGAQLAVEQAKQQATASDEGAESVSEPLGGEQPSALEDQREGQAEAGRRDELRAAASSNVDFFQQLISQDSTLPDQNSGSLIDQLA